MGIPRKTVGNEKMSARISEGHEPSYSPSLLLKPPKSSRHLSQRQPLSDISNSNSPNAKSSPIAIPRISVSDFDDDVFDESMKENIAPHSGRKVLFQSHGTSPGRAFKIASPS